MAKVVSRGFWCLPLCRSRSAEAVDGRASGWVMTIAVRHARGERHAVLHVADL